ncbi:pyrroline-5-carboxylate reductase-like protein 1 [Dinothrombium tinctorium]|uniref:Pyrroline-5-carboxylate reductase 3 n=1 Tax=Dinothrombium tinctorium TaxID=1965070 RepID=A0A3S3PGR9_9ACAR|nr:pyrroline-5-carboxylate reductase-like protein 1 [Dinothrombium tinctorium]
MADEQTPEGDQQAEATPETGEATATGAEQTPETPPEAAPSAEPTTESSTPPSESSPTEVTSPPEAAAPEAEKKSSKTKSKASKTGSRTRRRKGELELPTARIGFLGAGKMAECIIEGLINFAKLPANNIYVAAPTSKNTDKLKSLGVNTTKRNIDIFARFDCDIMFFCFHGSVIKYCYKLGGKIPHPITTNYIPNMKHPIYILSLVSGVSLEQLKPCLLNPEHPEKYILEMHRIMLNAACSYGLGICAVDVEPDGNKLSAPIRTMLSSIARLEYVPESQMDAACAIGGNGLAFAYYFIAALADGAFKMGLSRNMAIKFAAKTVQCASQCLLESGKHPSELLDSVSSPSGAAIYGIHVLDKADVKSGIIAAVEAAHKRAIELAESDSPSS